MNDDRIPPSFRKAGGTKKQRTVKHLQDKLKSLNKKLERYKESLPRSIFWAGFYHDIIASTEKKIKEIEELLIK